MLSEAQVPVREIDGRIKRLFWIFLKLRRQQIELDQVYDLVAIRIVTESVKDCYAALGIIHQPWQPIPGRVKDLIAMPRANFYQSLHTSVVGDRGLPFEVQIRTREMHRIAEEGVAAHWKYEEGRVGTRTDEEYFRWLQRLIEWQEETRFAGVPRSPEIGPLPGGSILLHAARQSEGCRGGTHPSTSPTRSTRKSASLAWRQSQRPDGTAEDQLKNGDIIEIMTHPGHTPSATGSTSPPLHGRGRKSAYMLGEEKKRSWTSESAYSRRRRLFDVSGNS